MSYLTEIQGPSQKLQQERKAIIAEGDEKYFRTEIIRQKVAEGVEDLVNGKVISQKDAKKRLKKVKKKLKD
jgi:hypothetical protein